MPRTVVSGCDGAITLPGVEFKDVQWTFNVAINVLETTGLADCTPTVVPSDILMTGTWSGFVEYDAPGTMPIEAALLTGDLSVVQGAAVLTAKTGCTLSGDVVLTDISLDRNTGANMTHTGSFRFSGDVTIVWGETS